MRIQRYNLVLQLNLCKIAKDQLTNQDVALKMEMKGSKSCQIIYEAKVLKAIQGGGKFQKTQFYFSWDS